MRISFDIDNTLVPYVSDGFEVYSKSIWKRLLGIESLRKGARELIRELQQNGYEVGIYTTSYRPLWHIRFWLWSYGLSPAFIINEKKNQEVLKSAQRRCSKYPPDFNIDYHVDDSLGVLREGKENHFKVIWVVPEDKNWTEHVRTELGLKKR